MPRPPSETSKRLYAARAGTVGSPVTPCVQPSAAMPVRFARRRIGPSSRTRRRVRGVVAGDLGADDLDAVRREDVVGLGIGPERAVDVLQVGGERVAGAGPRAVDAPDLLDRPVPELRRRDAERVVAQPLAEQDDGAVPGGAVDPVVRLGEVRLDACAEVVLADRGVDLGGHVPGEHRDRDPDGQRDAERRRPEARADGEERGRREQDDHRDDELDPVERPCELAVREREDREPVGLVVREVVEPAVDRDPEHHREHRRAGGEHRPDGRRGAPQEVGGGDERERGQVDEVPLDDQAGERGREVGALDRRVPREAHHGARGDDDEGADARAIALACGHGEHREERDRRQDPDPDRERAAGPAAVLDHPVLPGRRGGLPLARAVAQERDDPDHGADGQRDDRPPSPSGSTSPASAASRPCATPGPGRRRRGPRGARRAASGRARPAGRRPRPGRGSPARAGRSRAP